MTIIIVEGPDLSGKGYAIERLAKKLNSGFVLKNAFKPKVASDSSKLFAHYWSIINSVIDRKDIVILDRFFPSQAVCSYLRGVDEMEHPEIEAFDHFGKVMGFLYIYIDTPLKVLVDRYEIRGDEHIKVAELPILKERYDKFYEKTAMYKIKVDTRELNWLEKLEEYINEYKQREDTGKSARNAQSDMD